MKVYDLSHPVTRGMPFYPGTCPPALEDLSTIERDGFAEKRVALPTHTGTHLDAPAHILPGAPTLDLIPPDRFLGPAVVLDFSKSPGRVIGPADLKPHRREIEKSRFVILRTGWSKFWGRDEYFHGFPVLSPEAAGWIRGFGLYGLGVDAISVDDLDSAGYPVHKILLGGGLIIAENLTGLEGLPGRFLFCCLPLKISGADGSPARAVAVTGLEPPPGRQPMIPITFAPGPPP